MIVDITITAGHERGPDMETTKIVLDICTLEGKTWLARITGPDPQYGIAREFLRAAERSTSRSGRTGTTTFLIGPGVYERREGRRNLSHRNGFFRVTPEGAVEELGSAGDAAAAAAGEHGTWCACMPSQCPANTRNEQEK
jgi:hypothetical protein